MTTLASDFRFGFVDKTGKLVIPVHYDNVVVNRGPVFSEGFAAVGTGRLGHYKYSYIDSTGAVAIPSQYDDAQPFHEGLAAVEVGNLWGYIDKTGKIVIPLRFKYANAFSGGLARADITTLQRGFIDKTGKVTTIPEGLVIVSDFFDGRAAVKVVNSAGGFGYIDETGNPVTPTQFDLASDYSGGLALVSSKGKVGAIDRSGQIVIPLQFDE